MLCLQRIKYLAQFLTEPYCIVAKSVSFASKCRTKFDKTRAFWTCPLFSINSNQPKIVMAILVLQSQVYYYNKICH